MLLFIVSGFAGLIYESVWTHYLKLFLGHAAYAQSLVLIVFMGGMALGAALCARFSTRMRNPLLGYAVVEAVIGLLRARVPRGLRRRHRLVLRQRCCRRSASDWLALAAKLALSCALILPQSVLLGRDLPADERRPGARAPQAARRIDRDALFHQQPGRGCGRAGERLRADRMGRPARHVAHRGHHQSRARGCGLRCLRGRAAARAARCAPQDEHAAGARCCSRWRCSRAWHRSSTKSAGSACCRWCWAPPRTPSS